VHRRPLGRRQDDAAEVSRRAACPDVGFGLRRRHEGVGSAGGDGGRVPGVRPQPVPVEDRTRQRRTPAEEQEAAQGPTGCPRRRRSRGGGTLGCRRRVPVAALWRDAAACRDRPGRGVPARSAADGRAVRGRRRADPGRPRGSAPPTLGRPRPHGHLRHPRHRGGRLPRPARARALVVADLRARRRAGADRRAAEPGDDTRHPRVRRRTRVYDGIQKAKANAKKAAV
jgi:hypothetical protein